MWNVSDNHLDAIKGNYPKQVTTSLLSPISLGSATLVNTNITPIIERGSITHTMGNYVSGAAAVSVDKSYIDSGLFNPLTDRLYFRLAMPDFPDIPLFMGRVEERTLSNVGKAVIRCVGPGDDIVNNSFILPWAADIENMVSDEVNLILQDADSSFTMNTDAIASVDRPISNVQVWEDDRSKAIQDLMTGINCIWQEDRTGNFTSYINPFVSPETQTPVITLQDGMNGVLVDVQQSLSRANIFNAITVIVERTDLTNPIRITVYDNDTSGNTWYGGPFGKRNKNIKIQSTITEEEAYALAVRILRQYIALSESWTINVPCMPILDEGDVISLWYEDYVYPLVVESVDFDITLQSPTRIVGRRLHFIDPSMVGII